VTPSKISTFSPKISPFCSIKGLGTDHANDQKKLAHLINEWTTNAQIIMHGKRYLLSVQSCSITSASLPAITTQKLPLPVYYLITQVVSSQTSVFLAFVCCPPNLFDAECGVYAMDVSEIPYGGWDGCGGPVGSSTPLKLPSVLVFSAEVVPAL
jgi:hypothetical protein